MDGTVERHRRVLVYSQDSRGLGGFRHSRKMALSLVAQAPDASVVILTGSPLAGHFEPADRVDYVRLPGRTRRANGKCAASHRGAGGRFMALIRASVIEGTARSFSPDVLIVDGGPLGVNAELAPTVALLRDRGTAILAGWPAELAG